MRLVDSGSPAVVATEVFTPICDIETRRWEQLRSKLPGDVVV
ncbi:MAG: hypothetical protein ACRDQI_16115 [Pseudonocardiaceae bacterium]